MHACLWTTVVFGGLQLDCANGVGAPRFADLLKVIPPGLLEVELSNTNGTLNHQVRLGGCSVVCPQPGGPRPWPMDGLSRSS